MKVHDARPFSRRLRRLATSRWAGPLLLLSAACSGFDGLLDVDAPSVVGAGDIETPRNARLLVDGAVTDFECALGAFIVAGALLGDEMADAQSGSAVWGYDRRSFTPNTGAYADNQCTGDFSLYLPISTARWTADNVFKLLQGWTDAEVANRGVLSATVAAHAGYGLLLLGEAFCSAAVDLGPELTPAQVFALAEERFGTAITLAQAASNTDVLNMPLVGRARARINQARRTEAAADARLVPTSYRRNANYSGVAPRAENKLFRATIRSFFVSADTAYWNLSFGGVPDPRVSLVFTNQPSTNPAVRMVQQRKYTLVDSKIPIARGAEAQLIVAEVEGGTSAVGIINALHAAAGLPNFASTDPAAIRDQVIDERRRELFLEGQHLYDMIRL